MADLLRWIEVEAAPKGCGEYYAALICETPGCDRRGCTASEPGFSKYCCRGCAETNGAEHRGRCDDLHPYMQASTVEGATIQEGTLAAWQRADFLIRRRGIS
jgi:hypothetical protein